MCILGLEQHRSLTQSVLYYAKHFCDIPELSCAAFIDCTFKHVLESLQLVYACLSCTLI